MTKGTEGAEKPLDKMTVKELREIAHVIPDLKGIHGMNKQDLLDAVKAHRGIKKNPKSPADHFAKSNSRFGSSKRLNGTSPQKKTARNPAFCVARSPD